MMNITKSIRTGLSMAAKPRPWYRAAVFTTSHTTNPYSRTMMNNALLSATALQAGAQKIPSPALPMTAIHTTAQGNLSGRVLTISVNRPRTTQKTPTSGRLIPRASRKIPSIFFRRSGRITKKRRWFICSHTGTSIMGSQSMYWPVQMRRWWNCFLMGNPLENIHSTIRAATTTCSHTGSSHMKTGQSARLPMMRTEPALPRMSTIPSAMLRRLS